MIAHVEHNESEAQRWAAVAIAAQKRFVQDFPDPESRSTLVSYYLAHTGASLAAGKTEPARESLDKAVQLFGKLSPLLQGTPVLQELEGHLRIAEADFQQACEPDSIR